jgi:hypothetical protein
LAFLDGDPLRTRDDASRFRRPTRSRMTSSIHP